MVQTNFTVSSAGSLTTVLNEISVGGTDAAANTSYTIDVAAGILATASATLEAGSSVTLEGTYPFIASLSLTTGAIDTDLNFSGTLTLNNGEWINPAISVSNTGTVVAGLFSGSVLGTSGDNGDVAINNGTIVSDGPNAAIQFFTGTVQNGWNGASGALIQGVTNGVDLQVSGLVQNGGTITASGAPGSTAVYLGAGVVDNGQVSDTTAEISGSGVGIYITGPGGVDNAGTIIGSAYGAIYLGSGYVTNGLGATSALIQSGGYGIWIGTIGGAGTVTNFGSVIGGPKSNAVFLGTGGTVTNGAAADTTALISGGYQGVLLGAAGSVLNDASIQATGAGTQAVIGVFLEAGGTIGNLTPAASIYGKQWGAIVEGGAGYVTNLGTVRASASLGLGVDLTAGGTVTNGSGSDSTALIVGGTGVTADGVRIAAGSGNSGALVQNDGTIEGAVGVDFQSGTPEAVGTLVNDGLIDGFSGNAVLFGTGAERLVLQSAGAFDGTVLGGTGAGSTTTLELAGGTGGTLAALAANSGTVSDSAGTFSFSFIQTISLDTGASWTIAGPGTLATLNNAGTINFSGGTVSAGLLTNTGLLEVQNNATATIAAPQISGTGQIELTTGGDLTLAAAAVPATQSVMFAGAATLEIGTIGGFAGTIADFASDDRIIVDTTIPATFSQNGSLISVVNNSTTLGVLAFDNVGDATTAFTTPNAVVDRVICFLAGTKIATPSGHRAVEQLAVGDPVATAGGVVRPITWIGTGRVLATRGQRNAATPVIVCKGALGPNLPFADLRVTKGHALWFDGVLIPVEFLVNHRTILWDDRAQEVAIYHIELATHDVLLANGAPAESYRDDGNRWLFHNANSGWNEPAKPPCAPVLTGGPVVDAVWRRLLDFSGPRPGLPLTADPDLHLLADGQRLDAAGQRGLMSVFNLPHRPASLRLMTRVAAPQELGLARDPRCLGVAVSRIDVSDGVTCRTVLAGDALLARGFHPFEPCSLMHWTDGDAELPMALLDGLEGPMEVTVHLKATARYIDDSTARRGVGAAA